LIIVAFFLTRFSTEYLKIETKAITLTNHSRNKHQNTPIITQANTSNWRQARGNAYDQDTIGFTTHWRVEKVARAISQLRFTGTNGNIALIVPSNSTNIAILQILEHFAIFPWLSGENMPKSQKY